MASPITVQGLGSDKHQTLRYAIFPLLLHGKRNGKPVLAKTTPREVHIVDSLKAKMLIGMDIMVPEKIDIIISKSIAHIGSCQGVDMPLEIRPRSVGCAVSHPIHAKQSIIVPPRSETHIPVHHASLPDRDFFFEPDKSQLSLYAQLVDASMTSIIAKNDSDQAVKVPRNLRLGTVQEADFDNCYHITTGKADVAELATRRPKKEHQTSWIKRIFNKVVSASAIAMLAATVPTIPTTLSGSGVVPALNSEASPGITVASPPDISVVPNKLDTITPRISPLGSRQTRFSMALTYATPSDC